MHVKHYYIINAGQTNCTGLADGDYPCLDTSLPALAAKLPVLSEDVHHVPLPPELIEEFQSIPVPVGSIL